MPRHYQPDKVAKRMAERKSIVKAYPSDIALGLHHYLYILDPHIRISDFADGDTAFFSRISKIFRDPQMTLDQPQLLGLSRLYFGTSDFIDCPQF